MPDLYEVLQVHPRAEPDVLRAAYRVLARKYHPDHGGDARLTGSPSTSQASFSVIIRRASPPWSGWYLRARTRYAARRTSASARGWTWSTSYRSGIGKAYSPNTTDEVSAPRAGAGGPGFWRGREDRPIPAQLRPRSRSTAPAPSPPASQQPPAEAGRFRFAGEPAKVRIRASS